MRSAEGHRFRNSMVAGVLTGGIGFWPTLALSGAKYEYADSYNLTPTKPKYSGKELGKLQSEGVHVIVVNKKTASAEMDSARNSCKFSAAPTLQAVPAAAPSSGSSARYSCFRSYDSSGSATIDSHAATSADHSAARSN